MATKNEPKTVTVRTTMRPDKDLKVTELERETLRRQGVLAENKGDASPAKPNGGN